jgi:microcin C transport system substrate-binding protein
LVNAYKVGSFDSALHLLRSRSEIIGARILPSSSVRRISIASFEYFGDRKVAFEAFKAGVFTFREEFTSAVWATGYDFAAVKDGRSSARHSR